MLDLAQFLCLVCLLEWMCRCERKFESVYFIVWILRANTVYTPLFPTCFKPVRLKIYVFWELMCLTECKWQSSSFLRGSEQTGEETRVTLKFFKWLEQRSSFGTCKLSHSSVYFRPLIGSSILIESSMIIKFLKIYSSTYYDRKLK